MAIQNSVYGQDLTESEAAASYQPKSTVLTKLTSLPMPGTGNYRLSLNQDGTDFTWVSPDTNAVPEGTSNLYFTEGRARAAITGATSALTSTNLTVSRALISDANGKVAVSPITSTELGHLAGVTSSVQTQLSTINTSKLNASLLGVANGVAMLDSNTKIPSNQIPTITTTVGFGGEVVSVPDTGFALTLPLPVNQGGTGTTTSAGALSALGGQPTSPILTGISTTSSAGFLIKDSIGMAQVRIIQVGTPLTITNASGVSGNPTISLTQGSGSGLDADLLDGAHGSSYFKVDGTVSYSSGTATTIRNSISAASVGANTDITSLASVSGLGNGSTSHVSISSTGDVGVGTSTWPYPTSTGKFIVMGTSAGANTFSMAVATPNGNNLRSCISLWSPFSNYPQDQSIRRTADIVAGFNGGVWNTEYLAFHVGSGGSNELTQEKLRIDSYGNVMINTTTAAFGGGDIHLSKGISFPATQVASSNVNTLDDYEEGTWTPVIDTYTAGTGRASGNYYTAYTKIGNLVTFSAFVVLNTLGSGGSGPITVRGLPFTSASGGNSYWAVSVPYIGSWKAAVMTVGGTVQPGSNEILIRGWSAANTTTLSLDFYTYMQAGSDFIISGFYYTS